KAEGRPGDLGEREPFDDTSETHGLCPTHLATVLAQLPSLSFPGVQLLIVVENGDTGLFQHLSRSMAAVAGVKVIRERRLQEQRRATESIIVDRRRCERRQSRHVTHSMDGMLVRIRPQD